MEAIETLKALVERLKKLELDKWSGKTGFCNADALLRIAKTGYYPEFIDGVATITEPVHAHLDLVYRVTVDEWTEIVAARREWELATFGNHMETVSEAALINAAFKRNLGVDPDEIRRKVISRRN